MDFYEIKSLPDDDAPAYTSEVCMKAILDYVESIKYEYTHMSLKQVRDTLLSDLNYQNRSQLKSCSMFGFLIKPGDICFIDYGKAYQSEIGYQHFGLVIAVYYAKAFVIPMTSNFFTYQQAYDEVENPSGLKNLLRIGKFDTLYKYSVLYLNDGKYINTARIVDVKGHMDEKSEFFEMIKKRFIATLYDEM